MKEKTEEWLRYSKRDFDMSLKAYPEDFNNACYHLQQSSEKGLKSILCELDLIVPKTHDLRQLYKTISELESLVLYDPGFADELKQFSDYAVSSRYPGLEIGKEIYEFCSKVNTGVHQLIRSWFKHRYPETKNMNLF